MTYEQICEIFEMEIAPLVRQEYGADDYIALREEFNNWTDALCKDGQITEEMYEDMDNPY